MEIGVQIPHTGALASPDLVRRWCTTAEDLGFSSLWGVDHLVMPRHTDSLYDLPRTPAAIADGAVSELLAPNFELMTTLAFVAAITERIRIGSSIAVLTIRNAVANARQVATVDRYSGGRLLYGVGVGWLREESEAMNMPWDRRGARADEHLALLRTLWTAPEGDVEFHGEFWDIPPMDPEPRPVQRPIPILVGGHSSAALERAARLGDGWIAASMSPDRLAGMLPLLRGALDHHQRDPATFGVYCTIAKTDPSIELLRAYESLGVRSVQLHAESFDALRRIGESLVPHFAEGIGPS